MGRALRDRGLLRSLLKSDSSILYFSIGKNPILNTTAPLLHNPSVPPATPTTSTTQPSTHLKALSLYRGRLKGKSNRFGTEGGVSIALKTGFLHRRTAFGWNPVLNTTASLLYQSLCPSSMIRAESNIQKNFAILRNLLGFRA